MKHAVWTLPIFAATVLMPAPPSSVSGQGVAPPPIDARLHRTATEIQLVTNNRSDRSHHCRLSLDLLRENRAGPDVPVRVAIVLPEFARDVVAWRVVGDVGAYRIGDAWAFDCQA